MLSQLQISGFRAFRELRVDGLARVNLFVGTNNSGKTSILEAAELVARGTAGGVLQEQNPELAEEATLHRVEPGLPSTVCYTMAELAIATAHHLEVR